MASNSDNSKASEKNAVLPATSADTKTADTPKPTETPKPADTNVNKPVENQISKLDKIKYYVFDPSEELYYRWLIIISLAVLYNYLFIIGRASFELLQDFNPLLWFVLDYTCDLIYLIDIFVRLRTGYLEHGLLLRDCKRLALVYVKSFQFKLDVLSVLPCDVLWLLCSLRREQLTPLRFNRVLKIGRIFECRLKIETRATYPFMFRVFYLVLLIIVIIHWNGCFYFLLSKSIGLGADDWVFQGNLASSNEASINSSDSNSSGSSSSSSGGSLTLQYVSCFFWSTMMLTTIGEVRSPVTTFESVVMIVNFLVAIVLIATLVGNIGSVIANMKLAQNEFQQRVDAIKSLMKLRRVSKELDQRVIKWFDYLHKHAQTTDESDVLANLPSKLALEVASCVHLARLQQVNIFSECEEGLLRELVTKLRVQVYSPGDFVCRKGDIGKEMYIVQRGSLDVVSDDGARVFVTLRAGAFFGEISILNIHGSLTGNRRTANVRSVGYSDLLRLTKSDLWEALADYPANRKQIIEKGKQKLRKDKLLDEEVAQRRFRLPGYMQDAPLEYALDEQSDFVDYSLEQKFRHVEAKHESIVKTVAENMAEFDESCVKLRARIDTLKQLYDAKIGIGV